MLVRRWHTAVQFLTSSTAELHTAPQLDFLLCTQKLATQTPESDIEPLTNSVIMRFVDRAVNMQSVDRALALRFVFWSDTE